MPWIAAARLDRGWSAPLAPLELREPDPEQIIELITDAESYTPRVLRGYPRDSQCWSQFQ